MLYDDAALDDLIRRLQSSLPEAPYFKHQAAVFHDSLIRDLDTSICSTPGMDFIGYCLSAWAEMAAQKAHLGTLAHTEWTIAIEDVRIRGKDAQQIFMMIGRGEALHVIVTGDPGKGEQDVLLKWVEKILRMGFEFVADLEVHPVTAGVDAYWSQWLEKLK